MHPPSSTARSSISQRRANGGVLRRPRLWALLLATCLGVACGRSADKNGQPAPASSVVSRGDHVVVEETAASFVEGRVASVQADRVTVQAEQGARSVTVSAADIYRLPPTTRPFTPNELAICRHEVTTWAPCRVLHSLEHKILAHVGGRERTLEQKDVLSPSPLTRLNLERFFQRFDRRAEFERAVERAGPPRAPEGWRPLPNDRVIARQESGWFSATLRELGKEQCRVDWLSDGRTTEVDRADLVPEPPYPMTLRRGDHALARPGRSSEPWLPMRVTAVAGPDALTVVSVDGTTRTLTVRDLVPLIAATEEAAPKTK